MNQFLALNNPYLFDIPLQTKPNQTKSLQINQILTLDNL